MEPTVLLCTLNARYIHTAFGLRYIYANLGEYQTQTKILEFTISQNTRDIVESILKFDTQKKLQIIGFGVYIWNIKQTQEVVSMIKRIRPEIKIVLGGPEVSYETELQQICHTADLTIKGEADFLFYELCKNYFEQGSWPKVKWMSGVLPEIKNIQMPYRHYTDDDVKNRVMYVEASRGCPYKCEYCLSSLDKSVRSFDIDLFLSEMDLLIQRGARQFKFVDRTFNLSISTSLKILNFFYERIDLGLFLHFEMVPDRLPIELREMISKFPKGALQFEIGIQTWSAEVSKLVSRRQDYTKIKENFLFLNQSTGVHTHADLIVGLPGETLESFAKGFDALAEVKPDEIQVGILKRLRGTPIIRHDQEWQMVYQEHSPYQVLSTKTMPFNEMQLMGRFANFWDLVANSGNFKSTMQIIYSLALKSSRASLFYEFMDLVQFLSQRHPQGHSVALLALVESVWIYLKQKPGVDVEVLRRSLIFDYAERVKRDVPAFLRNENFEIKTIKTKNLKALPHRQQRHVVQPTFNS